MTKITKKTVVTSMTAATTSFATARDAVQVALQNIVQHAHDHGDKSLAITLAPDWINGMTGANGAALVEYLVRFCALKVKGKGFVPDRDATVDVAGATSTKWWELKPQNAFAGFDLAAELGKLIAKGEKAQTKGDMLGEGDKITIDPNAMDALRRLQGKLQAVNDDVATKKAADVLAA